MDKNPGFLPRIILAVVLITLFAVFPGEVFARAGGGGGLISIIILPFLLAYSYVISRHVAKKAKEAKKVISRIARNDPAWSLEELKDRIEIIFFKVQEAWMARDQELARDFVTDRLFVKHKAQTDRMIREGTKNFLERINLKKITIVEAADYNDDAKDRIWAVIKGSMVDIIVEEKSHKIMSGDPDKVEKFSELWKFIRDTKKGWVLDEIDQDIEISDLRSFKSFSESLGDIPPEQANNGNKPNYLYLFSAITLGLILPWIIFFLVFFEYKHVIFK